MTTQPQACCTLEEESSVVALLQRAPWIVQLVQENERLLCTVMALQQQQQEQEQAVQGSHISADAAATACGSNEDDEKDENEALSSHSFVSTQSEPTRCERTQLDRLCASAKHTLRTAHLLQPLLRTSLAHYCDGTPRTGRRPADAGDRLRHDVHYFALLLQRLRVSEEEEKGGREDECQAADGESEEEDGAGAVLCVGHGVSCPACAELAGLSASLRDSLAEAVQLCYDVLSVLAEHAVKEKT